MHGVPKELHVNLLDPGESLLHSGEECNDLLVDLQNEELVKCHCQEFSSTTFVKNMCNGISNHAMHPTLPTSMIWKPKD